MQAYNTNLSLAMALLDLDGVQLSAMTGADRTLISRWKNGSRRLMPQRQWAWKIAAALREHETDIGANVLSFLLNEYYQAGQMADDALILRIKNWLCAADQDSPDENARRISIYARFMETALHPVAPIENASSLQDISDAEALEAVYRFFDHATALGAPAELMLVCPSGIDFITRDAAFSAKLSKKLSQMFDAGFKLKAVLRIDFRPNGVASFSGAWLAAHLKGYIRSWYYDDFRHTDPDQILITAGNEYALRIYSKDGRLHCEFLSGSAAAKDIHQACLAYLQRSEPRFHYNFFRDPRQYLQDVAPPTDIPFWLFQRLPHFAIGTTDLYHDLDISPSGINRLVGQFAPLYISTGKLDAGTQICHILCIDDIENALAKPKHLCNELQDILHRRIYMNTQMLVNQLCRIRDLDRSYRNYHICFAHSAVFDAMNFEIAVLGKDAAVAWMHTGLTTATKDYVITASLNGFCATVWDSLPAPARSAEATRRTLSRFLTHAEKLGYTVD